MDANIIISALLKDSTTRKLLLNKKTPKLFAPEFIQEELTKYSPEFAKKLKTEKWKIEQTIKLLFEASQISTLKKSEYAEFLPKAIEISPDPKDTAYLALALKLDCPLWTQDTALKRQSQVKIFSTKELLKET